MKVTRVQGVGAVPAATWDSLAGENDRFAEHADADGSATFGVGIRYTLATRRQLGGRQGSRFDEFDGLDDRKDTNGL